MHRMSTKAKATNQKNFRRTAKNKVNRPIEGGTNMFQRVTRSMKKVKQMKLEDTLLNSFRVSKHKKSRVGKLRTEENNNEKSVVFIEKPDVLEKGKTLEQNETRSYEADEKLLKQFDLMSEYGACRGITRLKRYERAIKFNLQPRPSDVLRDILMHYEDDENMMKCLWDK